MGQFFSNQPRDRSSSTGHVHNRQCRIRRTCHKGCEGLLNQRTVDCCIKWMGCKGFKCKLVGFLRFKEAHECPLRSLHPPTVLCPFFSFSCFLYSPFLYFTTPARSQISDDTLLTTLATLTKAGHVPE